MEGMEYYCFYVSKYVFKNLFCEFLYVFMYFIYLCIFIKQRRFIGK